jgi:DNA-directed RNA polymerase specialized sigma24 family protein
MSKHEQLSEADFDRLIGPARAGDQAALNELMTRSVGYANSTAIRIYNKLEVVLRRQTNSIGIDDVCATAQVALVEFAGKPLSAAIVSKGRWLQAIKWKVTDSLRYLTRGVTVIEGETPIGEDGMTVWDLCADPASASSIEESDRRMDTEAMVRLISNPRTKLVFLAVAGGESASDIAKKMGLSRQRISILLMEATHEIREALHHTQELKPALPTPCTQTVSR